MSLLLVSPGVAHSDAGFCLSVAVASVLNNRWVRIGVFIASFLVPFLSPAVAAIVKLGLRIYNTIADIASSLQLTGQLLQGKFKELAVNLGLGLISSAISTIADRVMRGVTDALTKNGKFSFKNFTFKGYFVLFIAKRKSTERDRLGGEVDLGKDVVYVVDAKNFQIVDKKFYK